MTGMLLVLCLREVFYRRFGLARASDFVGTDTVRLVVLIAFPVVALWLPQRTR